MIKKTINILLIIVLFSILGYLVWENTSLSANYYYNKGKQYYSAENYEEASEMFQQALKVCPDNQTFEYFYAASLTNMEPTYYVQEKLYNLSRSKLNEMSKSLVRSHISSLKKEFLEGLEDNYIYNAISTKEIIHWNLEDFPIKVYIQKNTGVPDYYIKDITNALEEWENRTGFLSFSQVNSSTESDIDILFKDLPKNICDERGCPYVVATTENRISGDKKLEKMVINFYKTNPYGHHFHSKEIRHTALHELGHALGIMGHSSNPADIMYSSNMKIYDFFAPYRSKNLDISLRDLKTITLLYKIYPTVTNSRIVNKEKYFYAPIVLGADDGLLENKLREYENYIRKYPNISTGYINIASVYAQLGDYEKAIESLDKAVDFSNNTDEKYIIYYNKAVIYFNMQKFEQAKIQALKAQTLKNEDNLSELISEIDKILKELNAK